MSGTLQSSTLTDFSEALVSLVERTANGVVGVKSAAYRVTSGVSLPDHLVAVTSHSLRREERIPIHAANGSQTEATILGRDPGIDLTILKVEEAQTKPLPSADPARLKAGMLTAIIGYTTDAGITASFGVLGAVGPARQIWRGGSLDQFLRLDANVYPSQSGAAVVSAEGDLIGMATPALSRHAPLVIPLATIERTARELLEQGRIRRGYFGVGVQPVALSGKADQNQKLGLIFLNVEPDSPADRAGLLLGDVLLALNSRPMSGIEDLHSALRGEIVGKTVGASVLRGGAVLEVQVTISERIQKR